jgi:hypothetical protein
MKTYRGVKVKLHTFPTSTPVGSKRAIESFGKKWV